MATWVTHLRIADEIMKLYPQLDRHGFCVGNIAPDCYIENEDWTMFTPSREVTHWMGADRKSIADSDRFFNAYLLDNKQAHICEKFSFLVGYYTHLLADAEFQRYIRDQGRLQNVWARIDASVLRERGAKSERTWDSVKMLISKRERLQWIENLEAEYLENNPQSGYLTDIIPLKKFPDYLAYLPEGAIVRKIGIMGVIPQKRDCGFGSIALSQEEYLSFVERTVFLAAGKLQTITGREG